MKHATIFLVTIGLCGLAFAACAEGDETQFGNRPNNTGAGGDETGGGGNIGSSSSSGKASSSSSASSSTSSSSGSTCPATCKTDSECANGGCPAPGVGEVYCCDVGSSSCYKAGKMCPASSSSSSGTMY